MSHPHSIRRAAAVLALPALVALLSCSGPEPSTGPKDGPTEGPFLLRAVRVGAETERRIIPTDITYTDPNYTRRYSGGVFMLEPGRQWRAITRTELLIDGVLVDERAYDEGGRYEIIERRADGYVLDLYPDDVFIYERPVAVIRGDSLFAGAYVYVR